MTKSNNPNKCSDEQLIAMSKRLKCDADQLLASSDLISILSRHGEVKLVGSYPARLMVHGDIDAHIVKKSAFTKAEVIRILTSIIAETTFTSYFFGDWCKSGKDSNFPHGYYIGLKVVYKGRKWKIDLWFLDERQQNRNDRERLNIGDIKLTPAQKSTILRLKQYRNGLGLTISGQKVYEAVLVNGVTTTAGFRKWIASHMSS